MRAESRATNPSSDAALGTLKTSSLRSAATYCSSTLLRSYSCLSPMFPGFRRGWVSYLKPFRNLLVGSRDALYSVRQYLHGLARLQVCLERGSRGSAIRCHCALRMQRKASEQVIPASPGTRTARGRRRRPSWIFGRLFGSAIGDSGGTANQRITPGMQAMSPAGATDAELIADSERVSSAGWSGLVPETSRLMVVGLQMERPARRALMSRGDGGMELAFP